jgi:hypothetical protein
MTAKIVTARLRVVAVLAALLLVALLLGGPYVIRHRIRSNEAAALVSRRKIIAIENAHMERYNIFGAICDRSSSNARNDTWEQMQIHAVIEEAQKHDYQLEFRNCSQVAYSIVANPLHSGPIAPHTFCSDQTAVIHFAPSPSTCDGSNPIWTDTRP